MEHSDGKMNTDTAMGTLDGLTAGDLGLAKHILDFSPVVVEIWTTDCKLLYCNKSTLKTFGVNSIEEYLQKASTRTRDSEGKSSWDRWLEFLERVSIRGSGETTFISEKADGTPLYFDVAANKTTLDGESVIISYAVNAASDVSRHNEVKMRIKAEEKSLAKTRFLARMSYEIRTPITALMGVSELLLRDTSLPVHAREAFTTIHNSGNFLLGLANDVLDLAKIESDDVALHIKPYNVANLLSSVTQMQLVHLGMRKTAYKVTISPDIPSMLVGDELRIRQIVTNMLTNAFNLTEEGLISFEAEWQASENGQGVLVLSVLDTGIDVLQVSHDVAQEEQTEHDPAQNPTQILEDVNMGMLIVRNLVRKMEGDFSYEKASSEDGKRTVVSLPQGVDEAAVPIGSDAAKDLASFKYENQENVKIEPEPMPYGRVLIVDDVDTSLFVLAGLLLMYEIQTDTAMSGQEALDLIKNGEVYDIILMDHLMPGMDGITCTRLIREHGYTHPIIAFTANNIVGQEDMYLKHSFDGCMFKPIDGRVLDAVLRRFIRAKQPSHIIDSIRTRVAKSAAPTDRSSKAAAAHPDQDKFRSAFARTHRNAFSDITGALASGDFETAAWVINNVKNMAGIIGETLLAKIAGDVEAILSEEEIPPRLLEMFNQQLSTVLASIPINDESSVTSDIDKKKAGELFNILEELLKNDDADIIFHVEDLRQMAGTAELLTHIENFDFPQALITLNELRDALEV